MIVTEDTTIADSKLLGNLLYSYSYENASFEFGFLWFCRLSHVVLAVVMVAFVMSVVHGQAKCD